MKKNKSTIIWVGVIVLVLAGLFALPRLNKSSSGTLGEWKGSGVGCLKQGHTRLAQHIHPHLRIVVDGEEETVPAGIGNIPTCMAEIHTHDANGTIHIESADGDKKFRLEQFFAVWGKSVEREGYALRAAVGGEEVEDAASIVLKDGEQIVLEYLSSG